MKRSSIFSNVIIKNLLKFYRSNYQNKFVNIIKKEIAEDQLLLYTIGSKKTKIIEKILQDGHPSIHPVNRDLLLIDTYEKSDSYRYLYIYDFTNDTILELGHFYSPDEFNQTGFRCDLHPRWSPSGNLICVDTIISDKRQMIILDVSEIINDFTG